MVQPELISKKLAEEPIKIPKNPFWGVFKRFGRDEFIAMLINVIGTAIIAFFTTIPLILSLAGPIIEKFGFFPANFWEAKNIYKTTPKEQRKSIFHYFKIALKNSTTSLTEDILIHDPLYILFMFTGLIIYPTMPVWILAFASFVIAVILVVVLEVAHTEIKYLAFKRKLKKAGFKKESYYETRFFISVEENQKQLLKKVSKTFNLIEKGTLNYHDKYFENNLPEFSGRTSKVRLRNRKRFNKQGYMKSIQIIYTKATEVSYKKIEQYRYFPIKKEKFYYITKGKMPKDISEINNSKIRKILKYSNKFDSKKIEFERVFVRNEELLITVDKILKGEKYYLVEVKTRKDTKSLIEAMRYIMKEFPVVQTTKGKSEMN